MYQGQTESALPHATFTYRTTDLGIEPHDHECEVISIKILQGTSYDTEVFDDFMLLHNKVTAGTTDVLKRAPESVMRHLAFGHFAIAVYSDDERFIVDGKKPIIAQALVSLPNLEGTTNIEGFGYPLDSQNSSKAIVVQSVGIAAEHKRCGISALFAAIDHIAAKEGRTEIFALVKSSNEGGLRMFEKAGFSSVPSEVASGREKTVKHKRLSSLTAKPS